MSRKSSTFPGPIVTRKTWNILCLPVLLELLSANPSISQRARRPDAHERD